MIPFNIEQLKKLSVASTPPCISIFMPTHRTGRESRQDPIRLKNLIKKAEQQLGRKEYRKKDIEKILNPVSDLFSSQNFWKYLGSGLAVYLSPDQFRYYRTPIPLAEMVSVSTRFHIKPLLSMLSGTGHFYLLALSRKKIRLFEVAPEGYREIELTDVPTAEEELRQYYDPEKHLQYHTGAKDPSGRNKAVYHGHGGDDLPDDKTMIRHLFKEVNKAVYKIIGSGSSPLIMAGLEYIRPLYREANSYSGLLDRSLDVNPDDISDEKLCRLAEDKIRPLSEEKRQKAIDEYKANSGTDLTTRRIDNILRAAREGRIKYLFAPREKQLWGKFDQDQGKVHVHTEPGPESEDLYDRATADTILTGGTAYIMTPEAIPSGRELAALYRY